MSPFSRFTGYSIHRFLEHRETVLRRFWALPRPAKGHGPFDPKWGSGALGPGLAKEGGSGAKPRVFRFFQETEYTYII